MLILTFFSSCSQKQTGNEHKTLNKNPVEESIVVTDKKVDSDSIKKLEANTTDKRINLDLVLNQKHNDYLASVNDSLLSLCCYEILDIIEFIDYKKFIKTSEVYDLENQKKTVDVYYSGKSFLKKYYNDHPQVMNDNLVYGRIDNNDLIRNGVIQIGMSKYDLLKIAFQPTDFFERINRLDIYENELGESFTSYRFVNDTLREVVFDSDYDWISKELKSRTTANKVYN